MRISGIDLPENKPIWIALTYLYGIGRNNVVAIIKEAKVEGGKKVKDLTDEEIGRISKILETIRVEGDLRKEVGENIKRLKEIGSYRGIRHSKGLPSRGE
jgi:small subunit ribosomal protein S13